MTPTFSDLCHICADRKRRFLAIVLAVVPQQDHYECYRAAGEKSSPLFAQMLAVGRRGHLEKLPLKKDMLWALRKDEIGILADSFNKVIRSTTVMADETRAIADGDLTTAVTIRSEHDIQGKALGRACPEVQSADAVDRVGVRPGGLRRGRWSSNSSTAPVARSIRNRPARFSSSRPPFRRSPRKPQRMRKMP